MPEITNPHDALLSFQDVFREGGIDVQPGDVDPEIYVHFDTPDGGPRWTYVRLKGDEVTAFVNIVPADPYEGKPCFSIGVAVPEAYRNQGLAKSAMRAAIAELQHGLARNGHRDFYMEAVVATDNVASQRVAAAVISPNPVAGTDSFAGVPVFQYLRHIDGPQPLS